MARFEMDRREIDRLINTIKAFPDTAEESINSVLYTEAPPIIADAIQLLMPASGAKWKGKKPAAKTGKPIKERPNERRNLSIVVGTVNDYHYLYFPDDGTNTYRHVGNQRFFERGGEASSQEIADRCVSRITSDFNK